MSFMARYCCYGAILVHIVIGVMAYHFDVDNIILYDNPAANKQFSKSYFGYSVALWNPGDTSSEKWIFIGAPKANSSAYSGNVESGTVFKCGIGKLCNEWVMNDNVKLQDGSWLGSSISITNLENSDVVVCAPRWRTQNYPEPTWFMTGICYRAEANKSSHSQNPVGEPFQPLENSNYLTMEDDGSKLFYAGMGQSGFSIHIVPDDGALQIVLGCPGLYHWHGTPILYDPETFTIVPNAENDKSVYNYDYSGYAVTSGYYYGQSRLYVSGAPRSESLCGNAVLFDFPDGSGDIIFKNKKIGDQMGEYFGSVLASCDIDGNGRDDLLVGAPQWSRDSDEGRVYIFRGDNNEYSNDFMERTSIDGTKLKGRFGLAITCLGDIDYDSYADVAIGAPYDGDGVVYIYHGGKDGLTTFTQKISAPKDTKGFGISISEPIDIDDNGYADIAVGAYLSGHVALYRSKRVVSMAVMLSDYLSGELLGRSTNSFLISVCSLYEAHSAPENLTVTKEIKIDERYRRAEIDIHGIRKTTYKFDDTLEPKKSCKNYTIRIKKENNNFLEPLTISITQRLNINNKHGSILVPQSGTTDNQDFCKSCAIMKKIDQQVEYHLDIRFEMECGSDNICNSNLSIHMATDLENFSHYVIGSGKNINLYITVNNTGEPAYRAIAVITIPSIIQLSDVPRTCIPQDKQSEEIKIACKIGDPLKTNAIIRLGLDTSGVPSYTNEIVLEAKVETQSNNTDAINHTTSLSINFAAKMDIGIAGKTEGDWYPYTLKGERKELSNIVFQHIYEIKTYEVTQIDEAALSISIPTHLIHGSKEIEVIKLHKTIHHLGEKEFSCMKREQNLNNSSLNHDAFTMTGWLFSNVSSSSSVPQAERKFAISEGRILATSLDNIILHVNCTNPSFKCITIDCKVGPLNKKRPTAKLILSFDLLLQNLTPEVIEKNHMIFFVTNGSTRITMPRGIAQTVNNKPDVILIGTMFTGNPIENRVSSWIIPVSVCVGLLLLIFIIIGLFKFGFFKRNKKLQLEAYLKEKDNMPSKVVLETTSSREALDLT